MKKRLSQMDNKNHMNRYIERVKEEDLHKRASDQYIVPVRSQTFAKKVLAIPGFDLFIGLVIIANLLVMIVETDRAAIAGNEDTDSPEWILISGLVALAIFIMELVIRLIALREKFWQDNMNIIDFAIVAIDTLFTFISLVAASLFPVSVLRIFRLSKLVRVTKMVRVFPELRLLLAGLFSSMSAIFWGCCLLMFFLIVWAMMAVIFIHPLNKDMDYGPDCPRCDRAYSSVAHSALTFWQAIIAGDSWGQTTIPLIEEHPETCMFFIPLYICVGMAVMNLMLGVVVSVAEQTKADMEEEIEAEKVLHQLDTGSKLVELCREMDTDGNGELSRAEVLAGWDTPGEFQNCVQKLGIGIEEFEVAWATMDRDGSGSVSYKELITYLVQMTASDVQFMLAYIKYYIGDIRNNLSAQIQKNHEEEVKLVEQELAELDEIKKEENKMITELDGIRSAEEEESAMLQEHSRRLSLLQQSADVMTVSEVVPSNDRPSTRLSSTTISSVSSKSLTEKHGKSTREKIQRALGRQAAGGMSLTSIHDEMQVQHTRLCQDIATLRAELKDSLNRDFKFGGARQHALYGTTPRANDYVSPCCDPFDQSSTPIATQIQANQVQVNQYQITSCTTV